MYKIAVTIACLFLMTAPAEGQLFKEIKHIIDNSSEYRVLADFWVDYMSTYRQDSPIEISVNKDYAPSARLDDFILLAEDGIIMKDLHIYDVKASQDRISAARDRLELEEGQTPWIFLRLEETDFTTLNSMLKFLFDNNISYRLVFTDTYLLSVYEVLVESR